MAVMCSFRERIAMVAALSLLVVAALSSGGKVVMASICPSEALVYPYWSYCNNPARYDEEFTFVSASLFTVLGDKQGLAPSQLSSATGAFVVLSSSPATYKLIYGGDSSTNVTTVAQGQNLMIQNVATGWYLSWFMGSTDYILVEVADSASAATFQLVQDEDALVICPLLLNARCALYNIMSNSSVGVSSYTSDAITTFTRESSDLHDFYVFSTAQSNHVQLASVVSN
ncbi:hypothetical protein GOP47_0020908 [Adiantum capillus-veneris]|uniref:Uncharacterized protein n=1 Tax=Adiantum capillus-veneris TaxID=13818 RepID=A0A9D4Z6J4_ADICA|nr:hypothetical protein GOP47_0020908 [Adiantum capillus-veneris]